MDSLLDYSQSLLARHGVELVTLGFLLVRVLSLRATLMWQRELLAIEQQRHISQQNETVRILSTAYASEEPLTLDDLLSRAERDFTLRSRERRSVTRTQNELRQRQTQSETGWNDDQDNTSHWDPNRR